MKRFLQTTICIFLAAMLCMGLFAQNIQVKAPLVPEPAAATNFDMNPFSRGADSPLFYSTNSASEPGVYVSTLGTFNTAAQKLASISLSYQAMVEVNDEVYVVTYQGPPDVNTFGKVNKTTGQFTLIKSSAPDACSMARNPVDGKVYYTVWGSATSSQFGEIDVATGNHTPKGTVPGIFYIAIDNGGVCYGVRTSGGFGTINLANGTFSQISTYENLNFIQDMAVDFETNELYHIRRGGTAEAPLTPSFRIINKTTGTFTALGQFFANRNVESFVIFTPPPPLPICDTVTDLVAIQLNGGVKAEITWEEPEAATDLTGYKIYDGTTEIGAVPATETTFTTEDLAVGDYTFGVEAIYSNGCVPQMITTTLTIVEPPLPPCEPVTSVICSYNIELLEITVSWDVPENVTPEKYQVYKDGEPMGEPITGTIYKEDISELVYGSYDFEYCVLPIYADNVCEGDIDEVCKELNVLIDGIKNYTSAFSILPNPATNKITITSKTNFKSVEILSFLGQVVFTQNNTGNATTLDVSNLTNGIYFVRIISENGTSVKKFVKK